MTAILSLDGKYRYRLERQCPGEGKTVVIMVNPSTADHLIDDHTIRKLRGFGERRLWGRIIVGNLFAYRATDVRALGMVEDPVGPDNDDCLRQMFKEADDRVILAWGSLNKIPEPMRFRVTEVFRMAEGSGATVSHLGDLTKCGQPKHPLMLGYDTPLVSYALMSERTQEEAA